MSAQYEAIDILQNAGSLDVSPAAPPYSGVEIVVDDSTSYFAGTDSNVLTINNPWGTDVQANNILTAIQGFQYQPYEATSANVVPTAELGDGISVNDIYSGIYKMSRSYTPNMRADVSAPQSADIDHEYTYESRQDREFTRRFSAIESEFRIQSNEISARVSTSLNPQTYSPYLTYKVGDYCKRTVSNNTYMYKCIVPIETPEAWNSEHWSAAQSLFGWTLRDNEWKVFNQSGDLFKVTAGGAEVTGRITATSGQIGGFTIGTSSIYKSTSSVDSSTKGVYVGTDGIRINGSNSSYFKATSNGNVEANNILLKGNLYFGSTSTYLSASTVNSLLNTVSSKNSSWTSGSGYGTAYNNAISANSSSSGLKTKYLSVSTGFTLGGFDIGRTTVIDGNGNSKNVLGWSSR